MPSLDRDHVYRIANTWTGNRGTGTSGYRAYGRESEVAADGKSSTLALSADPTYRGDPRSFNPEELLVASVSSCHMLWYLHLCADAGVIVTAYRDEAEGRMAAHRDGSGEFVGIVLRPRVTIAQSDRAADALALHERAHAMCFIARSVNFPIHVDAGVVAD
jgi:organic hydroperoxide reductase OsmC/OhrA